VRDVREEGSDLALAVVLRATLREVRVLVGGVQERVSRIEVPALAVAVLVLGLDAVEEGVGDEPTHVCGAAVDGGEEEER